MAALSVDGTPMPALPNSADQINYDNTTSRLSATTVKGAVDELASEKQDATDDNLTTTDKTIVGGINELKSGLINVNTINNQCSFDVNSIRATFNAQSKVVSFDVRSNDGFTASTWTALLTITDATLAPSVAMYFPVVFINANRDDVVGHGVGKLDTSNIISVCPDDTIPAYSEAVGIVMWQ